MPRFMIPSSKLLCNQINFDGYLARACGKSTAPQLRAPPALRPYHSAYTEAVPQGAEDHRGLAVSLGSGRRVIFGTRLFLAALLKRHAQVQIPDQPVQVVRMYPQQLGRFREVSAGLLDGTESELLFQFAAGLAGARPRIACRSASFQESVHEV